MSKRYFNNPKNVSIGGKALQSVQSFVVSEVAQTQAGSGDGDVFLSGFDVGVTTHVVTVVTRDLAHGVTKSNTPANASATLEDQNDASITQTLTNVKVHSVDFSTPHEGEATSTIVGTASGDGANTPLTTA